MNNHSTKWCKRQEPRLSNDGTTEYLESLFEDKRVTVMGFRSWESKDAMCNAALQEITEPCVLVQVDCDELHTPTQIETIVKLFHDEPKLGAIRMPCRFFVGPKLVCKGENCWSNHEWEWTRAWRFEPGMRFESHEPPNLPFQGRMMLRDEAKYRGLGFDHFAYVLPKQVRFKQEFYGYKGLMNQWTALQKHDHFPEPLQRFFPFVDSKVMVERLQDG